MAMACLCGNLLVCLFTPCAQRFVQSGLLALNSLNISLNRLLGSPDFSTLDLRIICFSIHIEMLLIDVHLPS
jgi:hypothetical protein